MNHHIKQLLQDIAMFLCICILLAVIAFTIFLLTACAATTEINGGTAKAEHTVSTNQPEVNIRTKIEYTPNTGAHK